MWSAALSCVQADATKCIQTMNNANSPKWKIMGSVFKSFYYLKGKLTGMVYLHFFYQRTALFPLWILWSEQCSHNVPTVDPCGSQYLFCNYLFRVYLLWYHGTRWFLIPATENLSLRLELLMCEYLMLIVDLLASARGSTRVVHTHSRTSYL